MLQPSFPTYIQISIPDNPKYHLQFKSDDPPISTASTNQFLHPSLPFESILADQESPVHKTAEVPPIPSLAIEKISKQDLKNNKAKREQHIQSHIDNNNYQLQKQ